MTRPGPKPAVLSPVPARAPSGVLAPVAKGESYLVLQPECVSRVRWLREAKEASEGTDILFRLREPGRVQALSAAAFVERVNPEFDSPDEQRSRDLWLTVFRGAFVRPKNLRIPDPVIAHASGDLSGQNLIWAWATDDLFELWSEERRLHFAGEATKRIQSDIELFPGFE